MPEGEPKGKVFEEKPEGWVEEKEVAEEMAYAEDPYRRLARNAKEAGLESLAQEYLAKAETVGEEVGKEYVAKRETGEVELREIMGFLLQSLERVKGTRKAEVFPAWAGEWQGYWVGVPPSPKPSPEALKIVVEKLLKVEFDKPPLAKWERHPDNPTVFGTSVPGINYFGYDTPKAPFRQPYLVVMSPEKRPPDMDPDIFTQRVEEAVKKYQRNPKEEITV